MAKERAQNNFPICLASGGRIAALPLACVARHTALGCALHCIPPDASKSGNYSAHVPKSPSKNKKLKGFTLIELLVAISILAIVAVLGWRGLDAIVRARVSLTQEMEQTRGIQLAFAQMQSDCARIVNPSEAGGRNTLLTESTRVTMVRTVFADNQPSRMQVVAYWLRDGQLERYESAATRDLKELDTMWQTALNEADPSQAVLLQSGVATMQVRSWFKDAQGWQMAGASPPSNTTGVLTLPTGLEIVLQLRGREGSNNMTKVFLLGAT